MLTAMVSGYYEPNGNDMYAPGATADGYGEYCYDVCGQVPCSFHGPPGVRMVQSNGTGHMSVPLQVPPGHIVQQVVDENGTVRHYFVSAGPIMPVGAYSNAASSMGTQYYASPYAGPTYGPPAFQPTSHMQPALSPQGLAPGLLQIPASQCNGDALPQDLDASPPPSQVFLTQKEESYQSPSYKYRRKFDGRIKDKSLLPNESNGIVTRKDEVTCAFTEYLSNLKPPMVAELSPYSVMVRWKSPDVNIADLDPIVSVGIEQSEIMYEVMLCEKGKESRYKSVYSGIDHHCTVTDLKPATEYYVCVQASMDDIRGSSVKGLSFKTPPAEPCAPQPPRLIGRTKNCLILKWNSNNESSTSKVNYILDYDEGYSGNNFKTVYTGPLKQYKVTKLKPATGYRFRLAAMNDKGKSLYSETCCYFTNGNTPSQPSPPILRQAYINRLHLEWERRTFDNDFTLQIEDENKQRRGFLLAYNGRETNFICSGLRGNTEYKFRLCAINEEGTSPWSKIVAFSTLPDVTGSPGKPNAKGRIHASCFRVMWDPPKECKPSSITKYILEVDKGHGIYEAVYTGPETEFFLENLLPGTTYKLRVACITHAGHSPYSDVNSITTAAVSPGKCALPKLQCKPEASFVCLDWAHPEHDGGSAVAEYEVDMTQPDNTTLAVYRGPDTSCVVGGLLPGRPYLFQVRAYNRVGAGPFSDPLEVVSGAGPPDPPRSLTAACDAPTRCLLQWAEPLNNGAAVTSYLLHVANEEEDESYRELYEGPSLYYEACGLVPATSYYFKVRAVNEAGQGPFSDAVMCRTLSSVPGVICGVNAKAQSNAIHLSWTEPASNGSPILSYNVELDEVLYNTEENIPELYIEDLSPDTVYRVRVQAVNEAGEGVLSEGTPVRTLRPPPCPPAVECALASHNFLRLRWGEAPDDRLFTLEVASSKSKSFVPVYHGPGLNHKISRLQENTSYQFRICASNESGQGPYSSVYTFQTNKMPPPLLKAPKIPNVTEGMCQVEWTGVKQLNGSHITYQLQMSVSSSESVVVYEGPDTKCTLENLEPSTHHSLRVAAVRHCEGETLIGQFSPASAFTTPCAQKVLQSDRVSPLSPAHCGERRSWSDRHLALALVCLHQALAFLVAVFFQHYFVDV